MLHSVLPEHLPSMNSKTSAEQPMYLVSCLAVFSMSNWRQRPSFILPYTAVVMTITSWREQVGWKYSYAQYSFTLPAPGINNQYLYNLSEQSNMKAFQQDRSISSFDSMIFLTRNWSLYTIKFKIVLYNYNSLIGINSPLTTSTPADNLVVHNKLTAENRKMAAITV